MEYTYICVDILCVIFPLLFSFTKRFYFVNEWRYYFAANLITALIFILWDIFYTHIHVWSFNTQYTLGIGLLGLPLEEYLFFLFVPYAFAFTYNCFKNQFNITETRVFNYLLRLFIIVLLVFSIIYYNKIYTSVTFSLLAFLMLILDFYKARYLTLFFVTYAVILFPFFIANGILTGGFIHRTVVVYNDAYNLGIRLFTIPVEDVFYGMLLLLLNTALYEYIKRRVSTRSSLN